MMGRAARLAGVLMIVFMGMVVFAPASGAGFCDTDAPIPDIPNAGFTGVFVPDNPPASDPGSFWLTTGAGGFKSFTWDLGCEPWDHIEPGTDTRVTNMLVGGATVMTAAVDTIQRWAFSPDWIEGFLSDFGNRVMDVLQTSSWFPLIGVALAVVTVTMLWRSRSGDVSGVAQGAGWAAMVIVIMGIIFTAPIAIPTAAQSFSGAVISELQGGSTDPTTGMTDQVLSSVHYNSWLRRTFGNTDSPVVREHARAIFDSVTWTYTERDLAESSPEAAATLIESHANAFRDHAEAVCDEDPAACEYLHGREGRMGLGALEIAFSLVSNGFRLVVVLLLVVCCIALLVHGVIWVVASLYIIQPKGEEFGRSLLNHSATAIGYTLLAGLGSWGFGVWSTLALAPGISPWMSLLLLVVGTVVFWGLIRPDRKLLSLATGGRVTGAGKLMKFLGATATSYMVSKHATEEALEDHADDEREREREAEHAPHTETMPVVFADEVTQPIPVVRDPAAEAMAAERGLPYAPDHIDTATDMPYAYRRPDSQPAPPDPEVIVLEPDADGVYRPVDEEVS